MRLFAAVALSPPAVARLSALRLRIAAPSDGLRWTAPEQWHVTLHFFGDLESEQAKALTRQFHLNQFAAATLRLDALGRFPSKGILYASVERSPSLLAMQQALTSRLGLCKPESLSGLPFHPHITLARSKGRPGLKTLDRLSSPALPHFGPPVSWRAQQIALYESCLGRNGAEYRLLALTAELPEL